MTDAKAKRWRKVKAILNQALELDSVERRSLLEQACGEDASILREVESLLNNDGRAESVRFLDQPVRERTRALLADLSGSPASEAHADEFTIPPHIGRYEVVRTIGSGAFGVVLLGHDPKLDRAVAIKLQRSLQPHAMENKLVDFEREARVLARLDHPNIIPVYDTGQLEDGRRFVISKFIRGRDLAAAIEHDDLTIAQSARLVASVADALQHAHERKLIHRDVKPSNILIDNDGIAYLTDFGLTLSDEEFGNLTAQGYTPAYASPEQASGESHRVDGRSDVFSLGVVLYQLLTGERPFSGKSSHELLERIRNFTPRPPRQLKPSIPADLERVCLKALARHKADRYTTAYDMAEDLNHALSKVSDVESFETVSDTPLQDVDTERHKLAPKGLRPFDESDAEYYPRLLPGPFNRDGLPESIATWLTWLESNNASPGLAIGLLYGPSGSGKSSFIKAGVLPRLSRSTDCVYVESIKDGLEERIHRQLKTHLDETGSATLANQMAMMRRRESGRKLVLILDQFEQWLHGNIDPESSELVRALRQCDGRRIKCVLVVRDELWMAATELFRLLDISLVEGENSQPVKLFYPPHARAVLRDFGRALGDLPDTESLNAEQNAFLALATEQLTLNGRIIPVHLAVFAQMIHGKPWTPATLSRVGGASGLGVEFLEDTFSRPSSPPSYRRHESAIRSLLGSFVIGNTDLRGTALSVENLQTASDYEKQPADFEEVLDILDRQTRLITPTEPPDTQVQERYYRLTHDYLIPSIREWLSRLMKTTRRGRAALCLQDVSARYQHDGIARNLPTLTEYVSIQTSVPSRQYNSSDRHVMRAASRYYGLRLTMLGFAVAILTWLAWTTNANMQANALVDTIVAADISQLPPLLDERLPQHWPRAKMRLLQFTDELVATQKQRFNANLALISMANPDETLPDWMTLLLLASADEFPEIRDRLQPFTAQITDPLWQAFHHSDTVESKFNAGMALATIAPNHGSWRERDLRFILLHLLGTPVEQQSLLRDSLRPISSKVAPLLEEILESTSHDDATKDSAAQLMAVFDSTTPLPQFAELVVGGSASQFNTLVKKLSRPKERESTIRQLESMVAFESNSTLTARDRVNLGRMRAGSAMALLRVNQIDAALKAFQLQDDPEGLTQFIHRYPSRRGTLTELCTALVRAEELDDTSSRYAILLAMGGFSADDLSDATKRQALIDKLVTQYANDGRSAIHSAIGWLLRSWEHGEPIESIDRTPIEFDQTGKREWFVKQAGDEYFTFIVFEPGEFVTRSNRPEKPTKTTTVKVPRRFAITDREVTRRQYIALAGKAPNVAGDHVDNEPILGVSWIQAVGYCQLLAKRYLSENEQCLADPEVMEKLAIAAKESGAKVVSPVNWPYRLERGGFRLPTDAEWEYACRAGTQTDFSFGSDPRLLHQYAWHVMSSDQHAHPVALLRPNPRGLFDMHGNAFEWCMDWYSRSQLRVIRGGGWYSYGDGCRSGNRLGYSPKQHGAQYGFRMAVTLPSP